MNILVKPSDNIAIISGDRQLTFSDMLRQVSLFSAHTPAEAGSKTLIFSENRDAWFFAAYSIWNNHGTLVPVDAGSTLDDVVYIIRDCQPQAIWTSLSKEALVREAIAKAGADMQVLLMDDFEMSDSSSQPVANIEYEPSDICLICYTSGTTGSPKGVMLSYDNVMSMVEAVGIDVPIITAERRSLVLLPLHHVLPLVGSLVIPMVMGGGVAICPSLAAADIMGTLQRGKIGVMIGVPRLWQTLFRGIKGKIDASPVTRALYNLCDRVQSRTLSRLVFKSVRTKMGGHLDFCVSGGAALDYDTAHGLKTLGLDVLEGYGMTETSPIISFTRPGDIIPGCVGLPMPAVEVKLVDGELCARGRNVMQGYLNRPEETAAIIDSDGYVHTGDLATIDEVGRITITGRKKEIIVLSNGKNINPVEVEEKIEHFADMIKEAAVTVCDDMLKAIIVPQDAWKAGKTDAQMEEMLKQQVLQPYNETVVPYKKVMSLMVYHGELPRTRLDKLQRYRLQEILDNGPAPVRNAEPEVEETGSPEFEMLKRYLSEEKHVPVHSSDNLETDLALDSLDKVTLQGFIEHSFGMTITTDRIQQLKTVGALADFIAQGKTRMEAEAMDWGNLLQEEVPAGKLSLMPYTGVLFTRLCRCLFGLMFRPEVKGLQNLPAQGPFILAPNHQSYLDGPLVVSPLESSVMRRTYFYAKKDHVRGPLARFVARNHNVIIMDMSTLSVSIRQLANVLRMQGNLVIFPEGTRTHTGRVGDFKKTFAILSCELGVPVVPVRITGAYEAWPRHKWLPSPHKVRVEYLPAVAPLPGESYDDFAERVKACIEK